MYQWIEFEHNNVRERDSRWWTGRIWTSSARCTVEQPLCNWNPRLGDWATPDPAAAMDGWGAHEFLETPGPEAPHPPNRSSYKQSFGLAVWTRYKIAKNGSA